MVLNEEAPETATEGCPALMRRGAGGKCVAVSPWRKVRGSPPGGTGDGYRRVPGPPPGGTGGKVYSRLSPWRHRIRLQKGARLSCVEAPGVKKRGRAGGEGSPSECAKPKGWEVGVRTPRPASRAPAGAEGTKPNAPPGNEPVPSLPGHLQASCEIQNQACRPQTGTSKRRRTQQTQTPRGHTDHSLPVRPPLPLKRRTTTPHTGRGATAGAEETAASHSRDSNSAGIAGADANEDA